MDNNQELSVVEQKQNLLPVVDPTNIDSLDDMVEAPVDLMADYYSPEKVGERIKVILDGIEETEVLDQQSGEIIPLTCIFFIVKNSEGQLKRLRNGSKRLVGALARLQRGTPLVITYLGKKKNRTNGNLSDNWSVTPLLINAATK